MDSRKYKIVSLTSFLPTLSILFSCVQGDRQFSSQADLLKLEVSSDTGCAWYFLYSLKKSFKPISNPWKLQCFTMFLLIKSHEIYKWKLPEMYNFEVSPALDCRKACNLFLQMESNPCYCFFGFIFLFKTQNFM